MSDIREGRLNGFHHVKVPVIVFAEVLVMSATPETTLALQDAIHGDVAGMLPAVRTPTLVLHRRGDELVS